jgi:hypothetical protein
MTRKPILKGDLLNKNFLQIQLLEVAFEKKPPIWRRETVDDIKKKQELAGQLGDLWVSRRKLYGLNDFDAIVEASKKAYGYFRFTENHEKAAQAADHMGQEYLERFGKTNDPNDFEAFVEWKSNSFEQNLQAGDSGAAAEQAGHIGQEYLKRFEETNDPNDFEAFLYWKSKSYSYTELE